MWSRRGGEGRWIALTLACLSASCGRSEPPAPTSSAPNGEFSAAALDLDRPCTLLTAQDAANISGLQFYRTMAANLVEPHHVRCAQGVGAYGLHGIVELDVAFPAEGSTAQALFVGVCQPTQLASPPAPAAMAPEDDHPVEAPVEAEAKAEVEAPSPPAISGRHCSARGGGYALLLPDRVLLMRVRESAGEIDAAASRRLASMVSGRVGN